MTRIIGTGRGKVNENPASPPDTAESAGNREKTRLDTGLLPPFPDPGQSPEPETGRQGILLSEVIPETEIDIHDAAQKSKPHSRRLSVSRTVEIKTHRIPLAVERQLRHILQGMLHAHSGGNLEGK